VASKNGLDLPQTLVAALKTARSVTVLTGSGISEESGIPTFRDAQTGLWSLYKPEDLATPTAFRTNPHLVWQWYNWRRELIRLAVPNPGHLALAAIETNFPDQGFTLITQNVDGLHQQAGSRNIIELHGNIMRDRCTECNAISMAGSVSKVPEMDLPKCQICNGRLRPDVVWFGENLAHDALQQAWMVSENCDFFFSIGTSAVVQPAASLPIIAKENGATVIEINPSSTPLSRVAHLSIKGQAGEILPSLAALEWRI